MTSTSTAGGAAAGSAIILKKVTLTASSWIPSTESLSGIIRENMTFESGDFVKLVGKVQIASGYTVTFGAGSSLQGNGNSIEVFGSLVISGTSTNLIEVEDIKIYGKEALRPSGTTLDGYPRPSKQSFNFVGSTNPVATMCQ